MVDIARTRCLFLGADGPESFKFQVTTATHTHTHTLFKGLHTHLLATLDAVSWQWTSHYRVVDSKLGLKCLKPALIAVPC